LELSNTGLFEDLVALMTGCVLFLAVAALGYLVSR